MANNGFQTSLQSYANDRPPSSTGSGEGADLATDPASSSFFLNDYKKHEDLKQMLDSNKDSLNLEAMKRIIGMVAKGKDASDLFPPVVKNVVSKNIEVKKLVYVYLTRYAEEQQDLALLSISTFQRALKDPNQLIRASALRVLSSIRVPMIVPIMMLAIKEAVMDMSPYVRKTAAHAIPKLYSLDPEQKEMLIEVIEKLLADKTTLVAGSAIQAFEEVCPERIDLIHKNYRKLCNLLVDVEEWGQVVIINMLTRYTRTQFINPNSKEFVDDTDARGFYDSEDSNKEEQEEEEEEKKKSYVMDPDHRLLLRTCRPLLNSRNASVVMAVGQLYHHCAPKGEVSIVARALIRLLRGHKEVQYIVLSNIATMSVQRKGMFEPFLKSFYVRSNDPTHVKLLKLEILTNLANETNISTILREFQTYVTSSDHEFAAATIHAIGRCASNISEVTDACLNGLVSLLSNRNETVVGESVVVIKKLLQMRPNSGKKRPTEHKEIICHLAKQVDTIGVPMARASILWLIGEYSDRVPKIAPDVLRKMAKNFVNEEDIVKLQILNLATKLCILNPRQTRLLCQYVFSLAKYDQNYDIRDRVRFLRPLVLPSDKAAPLAKYAKKIFLATKPAPLLSSKFKDHDQYQLGTLSHIINNRATGYQELPEWPEGAPDPSVRNVEVAMPWIETKQTKKKQEKRKSFYSESGSSSTEGSSSDEDSSSDDETDSEEDSEASSSEEQSETATDSSEEENETIDKTKRDALKKKTVKPVIKVAKPVEDEDDNSSEDLDSEDESSEESSEEESESEPEVVTKPIMKKPASRSKQQQKTHEPAKQQPKKPSAMLLDLDFEGPVLESAPALTPGSMLSPSMSGEPAKETKSQPNYNFTSPTFAPQASHDLLNRITGGGLSVVYRFTRTMSIFSPKMVSVDLIFTNTGDKPINSIKMGNKKLQSGMEIHDFQEIPTLVKGANSTALMAIDFNDTTQPAVFDISTQQRSFNVSISAPVGEMLQPNTITENDFIKLQGRLAGMNENVSKVDLPPENNPTTICNQVHTVANVLQVPSSDNNILRFASKTVSNGADALVTIKVLDNNKATVIVNCDKMVIGSMLMKDVKNSLMKG